VYLTIGNTTPYFHVLSVIFEEWLYSLYQGDEDLSYLITDKNTYNTHAHTRTQIACLLPKTNFCVYRSFCDYSYSQISIYIYIYKVAGVAVIFEVQRSSRSEARKEELRKQEFEVTWQ
jgi:hypothetical protein